MFKTVMNDFFFKYTTNIYIQLNIKVATFTYRIIQISLFILFICLIILNASWNAKERGISSVFTNVEGVDNFTDGLVFDAIDFVKPPQEKDAFFITTKLFLTKQRQTNCSDHDEKGNSKCQRDQDCKVGRKSKNGINTGKCLLPSGMCEIKGWCPVEVTNLESDTTLVYRLSDIRNFTVYVRDTVEFFSIHKFQSNFNFTNPNSTCLYHEITSPLCPIFSIKYILDSMNITFDSIKEKGAIIGFFIKWTCYFNFDSDPCKIIYTFKRMGKDKTGKHVGYKFKYADYQLINNEKLRTKVTARGLKFLVIVGSTGYKFSGFVLLSSVGALLSYFGTLSLVAYFAFYYLFFNDRQRKLHFRDEVDKDILLAERVC